MASRTCIECQRCQTQFELPHPLQAGAEAPQFQKLQRWLARHDTHREELRYPWARASAT
jgi:hypothetical protein